MPNFTGQSIGRYQVLEALGEGGMATVYKAYDTRLERYVAIKAIRTDQFSPASLQRVLQRFEREAKSLAKLSHPNIVGVIDYGEYKGTPLLIMEYLPGGTLRQQVGLPMPWADAVQLILPIARGLSYAHQQGIIHRDVKPSNILMTEAGEPMLSDFGVAKILAEDGIETLTATGVGMGTPGYMAPEQWTGHTVPQSDVYGLGVIFYELITGRRPYIADTLAALLLKQVNDPLPPPGAFVPGLPETVMQVLYKALAREVGDRYQSMQEMARALEGLQKEVEKRKTDQLQKIVEERAQQVALEREKSAEKAKRDETEHQAAQNAVTTKLLSNTRTFLKVVGILGIMLVLSWVGSWAFTKIFPPVPMEVNTATQSPVAIITSTSSLVPVITTSTISSAPPTKTMEPVATITPKLDIGSTMIGNDGMTLLYIPPGEFTMGSDSGEDDEKPVHKVTLDAYWIDQTEVTNALFAKFVQETNYKTGAEKNGCSYVGTDLTGNCVSGANWMHPRGIHSNNLGKDDFPVIHVLWNDAVAYCKWAGRRLPTEAEWEKAASWDAQTKTKRVYPWGNSIDCSFANYLGKDNGNNACVGDITKVGSYEGGRSPYGAYDMAGNVWEWIADWYSDTYYQNLLSFNPIGPDIGSSRGRRGGSWNVTDSKVRSTFRGKVYPSYSSSNIGFRCAFGISP
jgi:formylglycine-generating enzyme required for sulfatase activity/tRNA A-37 threonylcarbamoyl transferase component Bud32